MSDLDTFFMILSSEYNVRLHQRESLIIFDEIQQYPKARQAIKYLVADERYDYINGDTYYQTKYADHNLVRTKAQYKLYQEACNCEPAMKEFIASLM